MEHGEWKSGREEDLVPAVKVENAEEAFKEVHKTLLTVMDSVDATIYVADMNTHEILFANRFMKECFGRR